MESISRWWISPMKDQFTDAIIFYLLLVLTRCSKKGLFTDDMRRHDSHVPSLYWKEYNACY